MTGVTHLRYTALTSPKKDETAVPLLRSCFIGSFHVGVSKRFSRSISLAVHRLSLNISCQISCIDPTLEAFIVCGPLQFLISSWYEPGIQSKTSSWSGVNLKNHVMEMTFKLESAIWSGDAGQRIPCFHRCQLTVTWRSNIEEERYKQRPPLINPLTGSWPPFRAIPPSPPPPPPSCLRAHEQYR